MVGKLRFTIKVKMHLRGIMVVYEFTKIIINKFPFTAYEDNKSALTVYKNNPLAPSYMKAQIFKKKTLYIRIIDNNSRIQMAY